MAISNTVTTSGRREQTRSYRDSWVRKAFMFDEISTGIFALLLVFVSAPIGEAMGLAQPSLLTIIGMVLLVYCGFLWDTARRDTLQNWRAYAILILNFGWVIASILVLLNNTLSLNTLGNWAVLIVADLVLLIGIAQAVTFRRYTQGTKV